MPPRAGVFGIPSDQVGNGQLHQAIVATELTSAFEVAPIHLVPDLTHLRLAEEYRLDLSDVFGVGSYTSEAHIRRRARHRFDRASCLGPLRTGRVRPRTFAHDRSGSSPR